MKKLHKEVVGRAADHAEKRKLVVEELTEEEVEIVEELRIERQKAQKTDDSNNEEQNEKSKEC